jgi:hypothetical protein
MKTWPLTINTMSCQANRSRALRSINLIVNTWPITTEAQLCLWILLKHDHYQALRCNVKLDGAARSDGLNLHANTWPITTEALSRPWILLKHKHYQSPRYHVKLDRAASSDGSNLHANTWPPASTDQPSFLFRLSFSKPFSGWYKGLNCSTCTPPYAGRAQDRVVVISCLGPISRMGAGRYCS